MSYKIIKNKGKHKVKYKVKLDTKDYLMYCYQEKGPLSIVEPVLLVGFQRKKARVVWNG